MTRIAGETVQRISGIINGLRTFSRDGNGDQMALVPVKQIVESTLTLCREKLKHAEILIQVDPLDDDLKARCRPVQISQVLLNLVGNACDAILALDEKWIRISAERRSDDVVISVTDSGPGIPTEVRAKLFQPFFTTKEIGKGTGLGLSISRGIVDGHRGTLMVDERCGNTRFLLQLPCIEATTPVVAGRKPV